MAAQNDQTTPAVRLLIADTRLREALLSNLEKVPGLSIMPDGSAFGRPASPETSHETSHDLVIATVSDCPISTVRGLAQSGVRVVILAPVPSSFQATRYREAGAAGYVAMDLDVRPLVEAVRSAAREPLPFAATDIPPRRDGDPFRQPGFEH